jgi:hypothetical protein
VEKLERGARGVEREGNNTLGNLAHVAATIAVSEE